MLETFHDFSCLSNKRGQIDAICLDLSKAFDRVSHKGLIRKLTSYKVNDHVTQWISAYLRNRRQFVVIDGVASSVCRVPSGVPQGSVLGPVLFLCYVNDLAETVSSNITLRLFADDCLLYTKVRSPVDQENLNLSIASVDNWCQKWGMRLNPEKTISQNNKQKKKKKHSYLQL